MKKVLFISGLCIVLAIGAYAQDKGNKSDANTYNRKANSLITIVTLDTLPKRSLPQDYPKSVPIPNIFDDRPLAMKDVSVTMPHKLLTGDENVMMPGTEVLGNEILANKKGVSEYFHQLKPLQQPDSLRRELTPKK